MTGMRAETAASEAAVALTDERAAEGSAIRLVRAAFEAFDKRELSTLIELTDPEIELFAPTAALANEGRCYRGHSGIARYLHDVERVWISLSVEPEKFREVGNHVVCLGRTRARARDGLEVDSPAAWVWELRAGKLRWGCVYADPGSTFMGLTFGADGQALGAAEPKALADDTPASAAVA
jgi:ketosteroid isomerase-like protein